MTAAIQTLPLRSTSLLRKVLRRDALSGAAVGAMLLLVAGLLQALLGLDAAFMRTADAIMLSFAAWVTWAASRAQMPRRALRSSSRRPLSSACWPNRSSSA